MDNVLHKLQHTLIMPDEIWYIIYFERGPRFSNYNINASNVSFTLSLMSKNQVRTTSENTTTPIDKTSQGSSSIIATIHKSQKYKHRSSADPTFLSTQLILGSILHYERKPSQIVFDNYFLFTHVTRSLNGNNLFNGKFFYFFTSISLN